MPLVTGEMLPRMFRFKLAEYLPPFPNPTWTLARQAGVTHAVATTVSAANQVFGASGDLAKRAQALRQQVDGFLAVVRAA